MRKIRVGLFGYAHPHAMALYKIIREYPDDFEFVGLADVPPFDALDYNERYKNLGKAISDPGKEVKDYRKLMDMGIDLALVTSDNRSRGDICCELLSHKINVMDEKPMAMDRADAERIISCAKENGAAIITNWPIAWFPAFRKAKELSDSGRIGKIMRVVYRSPATWGPYSYEKGGKLPDEEYLSKSWWYNADRGGGSILDYACYGAMLSTWIFGKPAHRVCGVSKNFCTGFSNVEDYSAMILDFGDGVGLLEGSWSTYNCAEIPTGPVIYGTDGVIVCDRHSSIVKVYEGRSHTPVCPTEIIEAGNVKQETVLGKNLLSFLRGEGKIDSMLDAELNLWVVSALDAGRTSSANGTWVSTNL